MTLYLIRHGQTEWNVEGRKQGQGDSKLTKKGLAQATASGVLLSRLVGDRSSVRIVTSPLERAKVTAQIILKHLAFSVNKPTFEVEPSLMEIHYGSWEGLTNEDVDERYPGQRKIRNKDRWNYVFPGGESYAMVSRRVATCMQKMKGFDGEHPENADAGKSINVIVTHDMVSRLIRGQYLGLDKRELSELRHPHEVIYRLENGVCLECQ